MFKGLAQRGKDANIGVKDLTSKSDKDQQELVAAFDGNEYWVNGSLLPKRLWSPFQKRNQLSSSTMKLAWQKRHCWTIYLLMPISLTNQHPSVRGWGLTDSHVLETLQAMMALMQQGHLLQPMNRCLRSFKSSFNNGSGQRLSTV